MKISRFLLRAALGGIAGGVIFLIGDALHDNFRMGHVPYGGSFQLMALPYLIILGTILGATVGCIIWAIVAKLGIDLSAIMRAVVGAGFTFLLIILLHFLGDENNGVIPPTPMDQLITGALFVTSLGALPGLLASPKRD